MFHKSFATAGAAAPPLNGIVFDYQFPLGVAGTYVCALADVGLKESAITLDTADGAQTLDASGHIVSNGAWNSVIKLANVPAKATGKRKYEMWGRTTATSPAAEDGVRWLFNFVDGNNYWESRYYFNGGSGTWRNYLYQVVAGVGNFRGSNNDLSSSVQAPFCWHSTLIDDGDTIWYSIHGFESDTTTDTSSASNVYTVASRAGKTATIARAGMGGHATNMPIRGIRISDIT